MTCLTVTLLVFFFLLGFVRQKDKSLQVDSLGDMSNLSTSVADSFNHFAVSEIHHRGEPHLPVSNDNFHYQELQVGLLLLHSGRLWLLKT